MDATYVTDHVVVITFPEGGSGATYSNNLRTVLRMLSNKHAKKFWVFNLSERRYDLAKLSPQVLEFGWPKKLAPPLERLCSICKALDSWLSTDPDNVAVLHSMGDKGRAGVVLAAYMHFTTLGGDVTLQKSAMKRFYTDKLLPYMTPSQKRYAQYFAGLMTKAIRLSTSAIYLHHIVIHSVPNLDTYGGCRPYFKIYQDMQLLYTSPIYSARGVGLRRIAVRLDPSLQLRGDILLKGFHRPHHQPPMEMFRVQFHTCALPRDPPFLAVFSREDLDDACLDLRFSSTTKLELQLSLRPNDYFVDSYVTDHLVPIDEPLDPLARTSSYENFDLICEDGTEDMNGDSGYIGGWSPSSSNQYFSTSTYSSPNCSATNSDNRRRLTSPSNLTPLVGGWSPSGDSTSTYSPSNYVAPNFDNSRRLTSPSNLTPCDESGSSPILRRNRSTPSLQDERAELDQLIDGMLREIQSIPDLGGRVSPPPRLYSTQTRDSYVYYSSDPHRVNEDGPPYRGPPAFSYGLTSESPGLQRRRMKYDSSPELSDPYGKDVWLNRQQEKLRAKKDGRDWDDRQYKEQRMLEELRWTQMRSTDTRSPSPPLVRPTPVTAPLHVQTGSPRTPPSHIGSAPCSPQLPSRSSSREVTRTKYQQWQSHNRPLTRHKSDVSQDRPFVAVRNHYQTARERGSSPQAAIAYGYQQQQQAKTGPGPGLLATVDGGRPVSPVSSKLDELEQSLQLQSTSPSTSPQGFSPAYHPSTSTPKERTGTTDSGRSWSPSLISSGSSPAQRPGTPPPSQSAPSGDMNDRPATPSFPVTPGTPYMNKETPTIGLPPRSPGISRKGRSPSPPAVPGTQPLSNGQSSPSIYSGQSRPGSTLSLTDVPPGEVIHHHPTFVKDNSRFWYKPTISRDEAIEMLKDKPPGTFVVRDSNSFPGAYGLAIKVAAPPPNIAPKPGSDPSNELVRHFLIEPTQQGVRIKGCPNEPVFGSLSALVYQHSILPIALPCRLILPDKDPAATKTNGPASQGGEATTQALMEQGAACSVLYLNTVDTECLTGPQAVKKALARTFDQRPPTSPVHFKVSNQGITVTDNDRKLFFRRHYPIETVSHCGLDPEDRKWVRKNEETGVPLGVGRCFGFVAKKPTSRTDNQCHVFAELEPDQPAQAIVNFVNRVMLVTGQEQQQQQANHI